MDSLELKHLQKLELDELTDEDLGWIFTLDKTTHYFLSSEEVVEAIGEGRITPFRLKNGPRGIVLLSVYTSKKRRTLEVDALVGEKAANYVQGIWNDLLELTRFVNGNDLVFTAANRRFGEVIERRCNPDNRAKVLEKRLG